MLRIVGISGKAGAGKDYVGQYLRRYGFQNVAFAWPLKAECVKQKVGTFEECFNTKPPHVRRWLQDFGVSMRELEPDYWVNQLDTLIRTLHSQGGLNSFAITDMRFWNELDYVRRNGGKLVRIEHGDRPYPLAGLTASSHISETELDGYKGWDLQYTNNLGASNQNLSLALYAAEIIEHRPFPREMVPAIKED
jgi:hypothetical protein